MLNINNLSVSINDTPLIHNLSFSIKPGSTHALMGPNGSGKSTLAHVLMGYPEYQITEGVITFNDVQINELTPDKRSHLGMFLAFQHPLALPGVRVRTFLYEIYRAHTQAPLPLLTFVEQLKEYCELLKIDVSFLERSLNDGFSGGEKKRFELLQMLVLKPTMVILDEIDSGLDIDGLKVVARALSYARTLQPTMSVLLITHYQRMLEHIVPDYVHVMIEGRLVESGDMHIVHALETRGYDAYR
jgi:Fe-S cluster assembly ATP-binding protein